MIWKTIAIAEHERGLRLRDGRIEDILPPGRHRWLDPLNRTEVQRVDVRNVGFASEWAAALEKYHPELMAEHMIVVRPKAGEVALVTVNGAPLAFVQHGAARFFWTVLHDLEVRTIRAEDTLRIEPALAERWAAHAGTAFVRTQIPAGMTGLLYVDGEITDRLAAGRHAFLAVDRTVHTVTFDLRPQTLDVVAQEILTEDRVSVRVNLTGFYRVTDPEEMVRLQGDLDTRLHRLVQFAVRDAVAGRTLDALLTDRKALDGELLKQVRARLGKIGVDLAELRIKDIILPGDMRDLLNQVVEAEKAAEANLIRRREETAATRSLLNTARLMENHPTLMRLKELEALERLTDKVGRIDVHQTAKGAGLPALLDTLMGETTAKTAD